MTNKLLHLIPRLLSLGLVIFLSLFALDTFNEYQGLSATLPFLIHLLPAALTLLITIIAWRLPLAGAITFLCLAIGYVLLVGPNRHWSWYVAISGPALLISLLYFLNWRQIKSLSTNQTTPHEQSS